METRQVHEPVYDPKPGTVSAIAVMTLVSGIVNVLWALGLTGTIVIGTLGIGLLCVPVTILPAVLAIFEIIYGVRLLANPPRPTQPSQAIGILEICCILYGNVIALVVGILALVFYSEPEVKDYFTRLNARELTAASRRGQHADTDD